jgi:hypothetical protein
MGILVFSLSLSLWHAWPFVIMIYWIEQFDLLTTSGANSVL